MNLEETYRGKSVFVTGHTGFKGSWLTEWLLLLGARVTGYSLAPPTEPALFEQLRLRKRIAHFEEDIRNDVRLREIMLQAKPEFLFHLAAQPLVRFSYLQPRETYEVNVMGTINVLEGLRSFGHPCASLFITTDKCYAETEPSHCYRECDPLGGHDPYSSSKAAAELVIAAYRSSFFFQEGSMVAVASARAGNVLGGGDWAADRIMPDCIRSLAGGKSIAVRNRTATRPWQHVLDPLSGYLQLGAALAKCRERRGRGEKAAKNYEEEGDLNSAFNFGPDTERHHSVLELVEEILKCWPGEWHDRTDEDAPHEARHLSLATDKASQLLGWRPGYNFRQAVEKTVEWYRESSSFAAGDSDSFINLTHRQIAEYEARRAGLQQGDGPTPPG